MNAHRGKSLSWSIVNGVAEVELHLAPCNEIGTAMLEDLERFLKALPELEQRTGALIFYSSRKEGFSAGADLRNCTQDRWRPRSALGSKEFVIFFFASTTS